MSFGRTLLTTHHIMPTRVSADGNPQYKVGGVTINAANLTAAPGADVTLPDGSIIRTGAGRYMRYGQILTKMGVAEVQTVTIDATGGTFVLTLPAVGNEPAQSTAALAWDASAAVVAAALNGLSRVSNWGGGGVGVALASLVYTITFPIEAGNPPQLTSTDALTGGASTVAHATTTSGLATNGNFAPYDSAASDGSQTLARGNCFILDETWVETPAGLAVPAKYIIGGMFDSGRVFIDRVLHSGTATASKALGPTLANVLTAFPSITLVRN